jgi:glutathione synthase/RimK-type ligase-like ATP-grasp enzyme
MTEPHLRCGESAVSPPRATVRSSIAVEEEPVVTASALPGSKSRARVALATCAEVPELEEEERPVLPRLRERGVEAVAAVWDDPRVDWHAFDLVVVRSTWDYAERHGVFLDWVATLPRVLNPPEVLAWSTDKQRYLTDLAAAGVPVVPTRFLAPGTAFSPPAEPFVVKPAVSAGGRSSARFGPGDGTAAELVRQIHADGRTAMVQPDLGDVAETALVFLDGSYSHALRRRVPLPVAGARAVFYLDEELGPADPTEDEQTIARAAIAQAPGRLLYGRVDVAAGAVVELELAEPSLYLGYGAGAVERFADAIAREAAASQRLRISAENGPTASQ